MRLIHNSSPISDTDDSHYYGANPGIQIVKATNGQNSDNAPGEEIPIGDPITWTYTITNNLPSALINVSVVDSDPGVSPVYQSGDTDGDNELDTNETWLYQATGTAAAGQYMNTGTATSEDSFGTPIADHKRQSLLRCKR